MTRLVALGVFLLSATPAHAQAPLSPDTLLSAVDRWWPLLRRAREDTRAAEAERTVADGAFDFALRADTARDRGFYDTDSLRLSGEQPLAPLGMTAYGGYRLGRGTFAPYDGKAQTLSDGEVSAGVVLPLLRDREVDARRTDRRLAALGVDVAVASASRVRLTAYRDALARYWDAVAAAEQWRVQEQLLALAERRDQQLTDAVALGQVAAVERTDNARAIRQRRAAVVAARRTFEQQAIELSLFYRDDAGQPRLIDRSAVSPAALNDVPTPPSDTSSLDEAIALRPELQAVDARRAQTAASLRLAQNTALPSLNLFGERAHDLGDGSPSRAGSAWRAGVALQWPLQRRRARGQSARLEAIASGLVEERRLLVDRVRADVQDALSAWRAADQAVDEIRAEVDLARELEGLERDRFQLGDSTQFMVNLRELATADAAWREVRALADRQKARLAIDAATGRLLSRVPN